MAESTPKPAAVRLFFIYFGARALVGLAFWIDESFGQPSIDQLIYHAQFAEGVAFRMTLIFAGTFAAEVIAFPLLFAGLFLALHLMLFRLPSTRLHRPLRVAPSLAVTGGLFALLLEFSAFSYARDWLSNDTFSLEYIAPNSVPLAQRLDRPRNLVLIYMESIEDTYSDTMLFDRDLLAPLRKQEGRSFERYIPMPGTTWTIAGMVGTQCGIPLSVYSEYDVKKNKYGRTYLRGATCLGDILASRGYTNSFMGGASLSFSGKGTFLKDHGYTRAVGREGWEERHVDPALFNEWGMYDGTLFKHARAELKTLHDSGKPFNLTLLTMNTHNPFGYFGPGCKDNGTQDFEALVACSANQVTGFIEYARAQGFLEDTVFVVIGDHLAKPNPVWAKLENAPVRYIFNRFIGHDIPPPNRTDVVGFDFLPSILEALGFDVPGGRLALGYSGFNHPGLQPPAERLEPVTTAALRASTVYRSLWNDGDAAGAERPTTP